MNASISLTYISSELVGLCRASVSSENKFLYSLVTANSLLSTSQQLYLAIELLVKEVSEQSGGGEGKHCKLTNQLN